MLNIIWSVLLIAVAAEDMRKKKIPDNFIICGAVLGIVRVLTAGQYTTREAVMGMIASTTVFFIILMLAPGSFGGGDVKLSAVTGFYLGAGLWIKSFVIAVMTAGIYVVYLVIKERRERKSEIAFGPFLCLGALIITWYR